MTLEDSRRRLAALDAELVALVAERQRLAKRIGRVKREAGLATRDFRQEREVLERVSAAAEAQGLPAALVTGLFRLLIESSLTVQERDRVAAVERGTGRRALVIGGAGRIGRWLVRFLSSQGFSVEVGDPQGPVEGFAHRAEWRAGPLDHDLVVVATPLTAARGILGQLAAERPRGVVFDVASLKSPLRDELEGLRAAGVLVASIHPMFGPDTDLLSGRHVILVDLGVPDATSEVRRLFAPTMATVVEMDLEEHDRLIAFVLGLSHAVNLVFAAALSTSGEAAPTLAQVSSTTFDAQLALAARVTSENPSLYYEIQALNQHGGRALEALEEAIANLRRAVTALDEEAFVRLMLGGRRYLEELRREDSPPGRRM